METSGSASFPRTFLLPSHPDRRKADFKGPLRPGRIAVSSAGTYGWQEFTGYRLTNAIDSGEAMVAAPWLVQSWQEHQGHEERIMRILACDDQPHITAIVEVTLTRDGHTIESCADGDAALQRILQFPPDLLICDCEMPIMSGIELCSRIRQTPEVRDLPVIMLTAKGLQLPADWLSRELGVLAMFVKPFSPRALRATVAEIEQSRSPLGIGSNINRPS